MRSEVVYEASLEHANSGGGEPGGGDMDLVGGEPGGPGGPPGEKEEGEGEDVVEISENSRWRAWQMTAGHEA